MLGAMSHTAMQQSTTNDALLHQQVKFSRLPGIKTVCDLAQFESGELDTSEAILALSVGGD